MGETRDSREFGTNELHQRNALLEEDNERLRKNHAALEKQVADLTEKLLASAEYSATEREGEAIMAEAAAIERAEDAERQRDELAAHAAVLREALEPFSAVAEWDIGDSEADSDTFRPVDARRSVGGPIKVGHFRAAYNALSTIPATALADLTACIRRETLKRAADVARDIGSGQSEGWRRNPSKDGCGGSTAASNTGYMIAEAFRALGGQDDR